MSSVPFLESAALSGFNQGVARKEQLSDEDHALKRDQYLDTRKNYRDQYNALKDENGNIKPENKDQADKLMAGLTQNEYNIGQLYDPIKAPGRLQADWHLLRDKIHGIKQPKTPTSTTSQTPAMALNTPAAPISTPELPAYQQTTPALPSQGGAKTTQMPGVAAATGPGMNAVPKGATPTMAVAKPKGLVEAGNIPIWNRPSVLNDDGTHSSELSISMQDDKGNEVLIPLIVGGKFLTPDGKMPPGTIPHDAAEWEKASPEWKALRMQAWKHYEQTGQHLGKFDNPDDTDAYAQVLHNRGSGTANGTTIPAGPPVTVTKAPPVPWAQGQVQKLKDAAMVKAKQQADLLAAGAPLSPQQTALIKANAEIAADKAKADATIALGKSLNLSDTQMDELRQQVAGLKNIVPKPLTGAAGQPIEFPPHSGLYARAVTNPDGTTAMLSMPQGWKPQTKLTRGGLVKSSQSPTGFAQTFVDPYTSKVVGWTPITPSRYYQGTETTRSTTDPTTGLTTVSKGTTQPLNQANVDLSAFEQLPSDADESVPTSNPTGQPTSTLTPSGSPNKSASPTTTPPKSVTTPAGQPQTQPKTAATPAELISKVPAPPPASATPTLQVDEAGHIPDVDVKKYGYNPYLAQIANNIIDGQDVTKIALKTRGAAEQLASKYGWKGQGLFNPREQLQLKEGANFLNLMANSPTLKVLDKGVFSKLPMTGQAIDPTKEGAFGRFSTSLAASFQSPDQQKFMDLYRQLDQMAAGLRALVQTGRGTKAQMDLIIAELPNPYNTPNSEDARRRLRLVQQELDIASKLGKLPEQDQLEKDFGISKKSNTQSVDDLRKKFNIPTSPH